MHQGCSWLLNIDLKNFFPSVYRNRVFDYFCSLGYEKEVCKGLTEICTYKNSLPQGAPTSPMLSNLIAKELDKKCEDLALRKGCKYTRYADDLTFSGLDISNKVFQKEVVSIVCSCGFIVNRTKTKEKRRGQRQMVTGLTVTNGVHVPKSYRKDVWMELHCCKKFGVETHYLYLNNNKRYYKQWLLGRIMFIRSIDKECGNKMLEIFKKLSWV